MNGLYTFEEVFDADALSSLAGKTAFLVLYTLNNGAMPHMSAFVDDIVLIVDYPDVSLLGAPESGPPGTTFLLRSQYNVPYGWVDVCVQSCGNANNHLKTVYADAAGDVLFTLETTAQVPPGTYRIETRNAAGRTAATKLSVLGGQQATLQVAPSSGPAGTEFIVTGSGFVPNDNAIQATLNDQSAGTVSSDQNGAVRLPIGTNSNTPAGTISLRLTDSAGRSAATQFTITSVAAGDPQLTVNPQAGPAGTIFNFIGRNFVLDVPIAILINGQEITDAETRFPPKSDGSINITLEISEDAPPGVHTLTAVQGNVQVSSQFEITDGRGDETDPGAQPSGRGLYLTLVWTDPPVQASASKMLVNDLDLIVDGPDGRLYGNGGEQPDKLNNVETIRLEKPAAGTYVVTVRANSVNGAYGAQPYALVGTQKQEFAAGVNGANISPTIPITETVTPTATATATMTNTPTATQTVKPTQTPTATSTETVNPTPTATETKEGTDPVTPTATLTPSPTSTPTATVTPTATPSPTATETRMPNERKTPNAGTNPNKKILYLPLIANDATGIQRPSNPATPTSTMTMTPTATETQPASQEQTATPTATPSPTATATVTPTETTTTESNPGPAEILGSTAGVAYPYGLQLDSIALRFAGVRAAFVASQLANTGAAVTTGTVTVMGDNQATYHPNPTDRLHVVLLNGQTFDVYITQVSGSNLSSPDGFLINPHQLVMRVVTGPLNGEPAEGEVTVPPNADIQLTSLLGNGQTSMAVNGQMEQGGRSYTVNLTAAGTYFFQSDTAGVHRELDYTLTGTVSNADLALTVNERYSSRHLADNRQSFSTADTEINNSWTYQGRSYQVQNGLIRRSFQEGFVNESEIDNYWHASGDLIVNGAIVGRIGLVFNALYAEVIMRLPDGDHLLQRFHRQVKVRP